MLFAHTGRVRPPDDMDDDDAIVSDILRASWFRHQVARVSAGDKVAVFGAGHLGQLFPVRTRSARAGRVSAPLRRAASPTMPR